MCGRRRRGKCLGQRRVVLARIRRPRCYIDDAALDTVATIIAALDGKAFRAKLGGEWAIASTVVSTMARAPKCRAADDLVMIIERHPGLKEERRAYANLSTHELLRIATGNDPLSKRALALRYAFGTS